MADSSIAITAGAGTPIDTFTQAGGDHRQAVVIGDASAAYTTKVGINGGLAIRACGIASQTLAVTAATPITGTGLDVSEAGALTFIVKNTVAATAFTGVPVIVFEQSDDNVSWAPLAVAGPSGLPSAQPQITAGASNAEQMFDASLEGVNWVRVRVVTAQTANGMTVVTQPGGGFFSPVVQLSPPPKVLFGANSLEAGTAPTASSVLLPLLVTRAGGAASSVSTIPITAGKTLRITGFSLCVSASTTTAIRGIANIRYNPAGAATAASVSVFELAAASPAAVALSTGFANAQFGGDGLELYGSASAAFGVTIIGSSATGLAWVGICGYEF